MQRILDADQVERELWLSIIQRADEIKMQNMRTHANYVANGVARMFGG